MRQAAKRAGGRWKPERPACEWTYESRRGHSQADDLPALREHAAVCGMAERGRSAPTGGGNADFFRPPQQDCCACCGGLFIFPKKRS